MNNNKLGTIAVTGGFLSDPDTGATNIPLYLSNAYQFKSAESAANLFDLSEPGYIYTRLHNPTTSVLENRIALLEGGVAAVATASGQFAEFLVIATLCREGDEIIASSKLYGGSFNLLNNSLRRLGINVHFADQTDPAAWEKLITSRTKGFYLESISNPDCSIPDFETFSSIAGKHRIPVIIDNTMATPVLFRPVDTGANIVLHSTTKYLCGNGTAMGGAVVDLGNFDWAASGRFPAFVEPDASYHGLEFAKTFGSSAFAVKARVQGMRDFGGTPSPFNSFLILTGLQTLHLRMPQHVKNTKAIAEFLSGEKTVGSVSYPGLSSHPDYKWAKKYFKDGVGALLTFNIIGGYESAKRFIEGLKLCVHATNIGDSRTIITHPASTTHRQLSEAQLAAAGIDKSLIRVSAGIEDVSDIIGDIRQALQKA
ncbi:MAG: O-acetylhomoserine aminocarboxypropyltransferase/cysteine synthase [Deferribacteraceae bacterium]|jgi:O-acetylhomoserine (thiol)-lyase|nr:O-acetylhomoserine aminocarboxypropyltransferase/cysteine synthase [Deferribacteraceae bacterium]